MRTLCTKQRRIVKEQKLPMPSYRRQKRRFGDPAEMQNFPDEAKLWETGEPWKELTPPASHDSRQFLSLTVLRHQAADMML